MVLRGRHREDVFAVDHDDEGGFFAVEVVFDHDAGARVPEFMAFEHHVDRFVGGVFRHRDDDALPGGEAVGLHHDRSALLRDVFVRGGGIGEAFVVGGGNAVALHESLGEVLGAFELRRGARGPEDAKTPGAELVHDPGGERRFGTDEREGDAFAFGEVGELIEIRDGEVFKAFRHGRPGIARGDEHLFHAGTLRQAPGEGVFTAAVADNEKLHKRVLREKR